MIFSVSFVQNLMTFGSVELLMQWLMKSALLSLKIWTFQKTPDASERSVSRMRSLEYKETKPRFLMSEPMKLCNGRNRVRDGIDRIGWVCD